LGLVRNGRILKLRLLYISRIITSAKSIKPYAARPQWRAALKKVFGRLAI
jgi:hypothetical protein